MYIYDLLVYGWLCRKRLNNNCFFILTYSNLLTFCTVSIVYIMYTVFSHVNINCRIYLVYSHALCDP